MPFIQWQSYFCERYLHQGKYFYDKMPLFSFHYVVFIYVFVPNEMLHFCNFCIQFRNTSYRI